MGAPTSKVRAVVYKREGGRCVRCGSTELTFQHRRATGQGGSPLPVMVTDGLGACSVCNGGFEHIGQTEALVHGWKVQRWVTDPGMVPVFNRTRGRWGLLTDAGEVVLISAREALAAMRHVYGDKWDRWAAVVAPDGMKGLLP